jgi:hypothetical protein
VACLGSDDCDDGVFCNGAEACNAGVCEAGAAPACGGGTPYCDESLDACVACLGSDGCPGGSVCGGTGSCEVAAPIPAAPSPFAWLAALGILAAAWLALRPARR